MKLLENLDPVLLSILKEEIEAGNKIIEARKMNESSRSVEISLVSPFCRNYESEGIEKSVETDPHYNCVDYASTSGNKISAPYK